MMFRKYLGAMRINPAMLYVVLDLHRDQNVINEAEFMICVPLVLMSYSGTDSFKMLL